jgi:hypothetical protein
MLSDVIKLQPENPLTEIGKIESKIKNYLGLLSDLKRY